MMRKSNSLITWRSGAVAALLGLIGGFSLETAAYAQQTINATDLVARLRRLERDVRDLQAETFRRSPDAGKAGAAGAPPPPEPAAQAGPDLSPVMRRVDDLEATVSRL